MDVQEVKDTINFISKLLEVMNNHAKVHNIDLVYNGFSDDLHVYEERLLNISNKITDAIESASIEKYENINKEAIDLKNELDLSELMYNFLKHRFQIARDQSVENPSEYLVGNEIHYNKLLIESKKEIQENCEHEYNSKQEKEKEIIDRQYSSDLDRLTNQVNEEIKTNTLKVIELDKENENLKEVTPFYLECFLDVYHFKT